MSGSWANLIRPVDVGGMVAQGFQQGTQNREQNMAKAAMAALVRDPSNAKAFEALSSVDPGAAQQFKQQQLEQAKAQLGAHYDSVIKGAQLIRQMQPKDDASWQQVRAMAGQVGIDISEVPEHFDPQYVSNIVHLADTFAPEQQHQGTASIQDYEYAKNNGYDGSFVDYQQVIHPPGPVTMPAGATVTPPQPNVPHVSDQSSYDAIPPGGQYMTPDGHIRVKGGQAGQSSPAPF